MIFFVQQRHFNTEQQDLQMGRVGWGREKENGVQSLPQDQRSKENIFTTVPLKEEKKVPVKSANWVTPVS